MKTNILIVGRGSIGQQHYVTLTNLGFSVEIKSGRDVMSKDTDILSALLTNFTHIVIAIPLQYRGQLLSMSVSMGLSVYCEKPLLKSFDDLSALRVLDKRKVYIGYMLRFSEAFQKFKVLVDGLDAPYMFLSQVGSDISTWRKTDWNNGYAMDIDGGGVLLDLSHDLDLIFNLTTESWDIQDVVCLDKTLHEKVDFVTQVSLISKSLIASISMDYINKIGVRTIRVFSVDKNITLDLNRNIITDEAKVLYSFNDTRQDFFKRSMISWLEEREDLNLSNDFNMKSVETIMKCYLNRRFVDNLK